MARILRGAQRAVLVAFVLFGAGGCPDLGNPCEPAYKRWCEGDKVMVCGDHSEFGLDIDLEETCNPGMCVQVPDDFSVSDAYCKARQEPCPKGAQAICMGEILANCRPNGDAVEINDCSWYAKSDGAKESHCVQEGDDAGCSIRWR